VSLLDDLREHPEHYSLFGALRRTMAKAGYSDLKEFQKVGLSVHA